MVNWLYLDLNSFFASCEEQEHPQFRGRPLAVVPMKADSTSVLAASYKAKAFGVKTGTRVSEARKMCPGILFVQSDHKIYIEYHHKIIRAVESCLPVHSICSIDEIACELTGSHRQIARACELAAQVKAAIKDQVGEYLTSSIGLAPNMYLAKVATDMMKPNGLTILKLEDLPHKLGQLKLKDLPGIGPRMETRLWAQGVRTMEQLISKNETEMRSLWGGILGSRMYHLIRGESFSVPRESGKSISHQHVLPPAQRNSSDAYYVALKLLDKAALRLRKADMLTQRLGLAIRCVSGYRIDESMGCENTQDTMLLAKMLMKLWRKLPREEKPFKVSVVLYDFVASSEEQLSFFQDPKKQELFKSVDRLNEKFGAKTVMMGGLLNQKTAAPTRIAFHRIPELEEFD